MQEPRQASYCLLLMLWLFSLPKALGQDVDLAPVSGTYAIQNANIIQAPGRFIEMGAVVIKDGVIQSVGKGVTIPADAQILKLDSMYVYAGFIDGLSHIGVPKPKENKIDKDKIKNPGSPPDELAGIQPQLEVTTMLDPKDKSVIDWRKLGFTTVHTVPYGKMLPGQGAIVLLTGNSADDMIYKNHSSMFSQLSGAQRMYPSTVIGVMAKYRDLYRKAGQSSDYEGRYNANPSGMIRPEKEGVEMAFYPVIENKMPVAFKAEEVLDVQRVLTLKTELGFGLILGEVKEGWDIIPKIKSSGAKTFLSLDLPEIKEEEKNDSTQTEDMKKEPTAADKEKEALEMRKKEIIDKHYSQPAAFKKQGVRFGFSTMETKSSDFKKNLVQLKEHGMTDDDLLAALTTHPAELLGLSTVMGSIDPGKMANLVITDKPYFEEKSSIKHVFVDGALYSFEEKKKKKNGPEEDAKPEGKWSYSSETPNGTVTGEIEIKGSDGSYSGTISNSYSGEKVDMNEVLVDGSQLQISYKIDAGGNLLVIEINAEIDGDSFEGTMSAGQYGTFEIEGQKVPEK